MPTSALIGSEAPSRVEWAFRMGADAQILQRVGDDGMYSSLLIARTSFDARRVLARQIEEFRGRLSERQMVVRAVSAELRRRAMDWRVRSRKPPRGCWRQGRGPCPTPGS